MENVIDEQKIKRSLKKYCSEVNKYYKAGNIESSYNKPVIAIPHNGCRPRYFRFATR